MAQANRLLRDSATTTPAAATAKILDILGSIKPHRIPVSGASIADIEQCAEQVAQTINLCAEQLRGLLGNLNSNLPVTAHIEVRDFFNGLADLKSEILGVIEHAAERQAA